MPFLKLQVNGTRLLRKPHSAFKTSYYPSLFWNKKIANTFPIDISIEVVLPRTRLIGCIRCKTKTLMGEKRDVVKEINLTGFIVYF